jgi:hypothetical protein
MLSLRAAKALAVTAIDVLTLPEVLRAVQEEFRSMHDVASRI